MGAGISPVVTSAMPQPGPASASNPAQPQPAQTTTPLPQASGKGSTSPSTVPTQQSGKMGGTDNTQIQSPHGPQPNSNQTQPNLGGFAGGGTNFSPTQATGSQPTIGNPNQYAQTIGMGNNMGSKTPSPIGAGGKSGKGG